MPKTAGVTKEQARSTTWWWVAWLISHQGQLCHNYHFLRRFFQARNTIFALPNGVVFRKTIIHSIMAKAEWWYSGQLFLTGLWSPCILVACLQVASLPGGESSWLRGDRKPWVAMVEVNSRKHHFVHPPSYVLRWPLEDSKKVFLGPRNRHPHHQMYLAWGLAISRCLTWSLLQQDRSVSILHESLQLLFEAWQL